MTGCRVIANPTGSPCYCGCHYSFSLEPARQPPMDDETLEQYVRQYIAAQPDTTVEFIWQGGEPTLAGLDFYHRAVALQTRFANGKRIQNTLQTNGTLLSDAWCKFLRHHGWRVSIAIDGPAEFHDACRAARGENPTHQAAIEAAGRLREWGVEFTLRVVVNALNAREPQRVYRYLKALGTPFIQFIPLVAQNASGQCGPASVSGRAWGQFLTQIFDLWVREDIGQVYIQIFDATLSAWSGSSPRVCALSQSCGHVFTLEANGDLYACDCGVCCDYRAGNLHIDALETINRSEAVRRLAGHKRASLSEACQRCDVRYLCHGDCPKHRLDEGKSVLCEGYRHFFSHTAPCMRVMRDLMAQHRSPAELMAMLGSA